MITWMQTHRKWLVITIWIATISFVGAGFVGWGAYSYGKKDSTVAVVKDTEVTLKDWQEAYNILFQQYNAQFFGGRLDEATAKQLGLQKMALKQAVNMAILKQFAKDNGLIVTDIEVAEKIASQPYFQKNGKFDKETYKKLLKQNGLKPSQYETKLKNEILVQKIIKLITPKSTETEIKSVASVGLMQDNISIKIVKADKIRVKVTEDEIKKYWEQHKNEYKSPVTYTIAYFFSKLNRDIKDEEVKKYYDKNRFKYKDENGKILSFDKAKELAKEDLIAEKSKKDAIIDYKKLKADKLQFKTAENVGLENNITTIENMNKIIGANKKIVKPIYTPKGYLIAKLVVINPPKTLPFEKAKELAKEDLISEKRNNKLIELAKENLKNFKGKNIGFISRDDASKIKELSFDEANEFVTNLFTSKKAEDFMLLPSDMPEKAVIFKITEQKLLDEDKYKKQKVLFQNMSDSLLSNELYSSLIKKLTQIYKIEVYTKDKN